MKVVLSINVMKDIVEDGVKEMKSRMNFTTSQRLLKRKVLSEIFKYRDILVSEFLPVLVSDFGESIEVQFTGVKMKEDEVKKLKNFISLLKKSEDRQYMLSLVNGIRESLQGEDLIARMTHLAEESHDWIMRRIELYIRREVLDTMYKKTAEKCKLEFTIYNFTKEELPEDVKQMFKNGVDAVPRTKSSKKEIRDRVNDSLLEYLERFRWHKKQSSIKASSVLEWINIALEKEADEESQEFYKKFKDSYPGMMNDLDIVYHEHDLESLDEIRKKLEIDGSIIVPCDKNMGMSMFTLKTMREVEAKLMAQLGATKIDMEKEEILDRVLSEIDEFEKNLDSDQHDYLEFAYKNRNVRAIRSGIIFPFLRSTHKVHKMTPEEIAMKDLTDLKFKPVVDARRWVTRGYSTLIMNMMRRAVQDLLSKAGPILRDIKVKNGWRFAVALSDIKFREEFDVSFSADIQEAYTNVTADMIKEAIRKVCGFISVYVAVNMEI